jgi:dihydroflavonol-4-reductase
MKAFVTGATGFVGSHIVEKLLRAGAEVVCLVRPTSDIRWLAGLPVRLAKVAKPDPAELADALGGCTHVFHVAGVVRALKESEYHDGNVRFTAQLLEACQRKKKQVSRFVHISSQAAAGPARNDAPTRECDECRPVSAYGRSKLMAEREVAKFASEFPVCILRPSAVYGPRDRDIFWFFRLASLGLRPLVGRSSMVSLIFVGDVARAAVMAAENNASAGRTYFLADPEPYSTEQLSCEIAKALDREFTARIHIPRAGIIGAGWVATAASRISNKALTFGIDKATEMIQQFWVCDTSEITRDIGFKPSVTLQEGLKITAAWYKQQKWL